MSELCIIVRMTDYYIHNNNENEINKFHVLTYAETVTAISCEFS